MSPEFSDLACGLECCGDRLQRSSQRVERGEADGHIVRPYPLLAEGERRSIPLAAGLKRCRASLCGALSPRPGPGPRTGRPSRPPARPGVSQKVRLGGPAPLCSNALGPLSHSREPLSDLCCADRSLPAPPPPQAGPASQGPPATTQGGQGEGCRLGSPREGRLQHSILVLGSGDIKSHGWDLEGFQV